MFVFISSLTATTSGIFGTIYIIQGLFCHENKKTTNTQLLKRGLIGEPIPLNEFMLFS